MKTLTWLLIGFLMMNLNLIAQEDEDEPKEDESTLINKLIVQKTGLDLDSLKGQAAINDFIWNKYNKFAEKFYNITTEFQPEKWNTFKAKLVEMAKAQGLDSKTLSKCLTFVKTDTEALLLPVSAYYAKKGDAQIWILTCAWQIPDKKDATTFQKFGHTKVWALIADTQQQVGYKTCK